MDALPILLGGLFLAILGGGYAVYRWGGASAEAKREVAEDAKNEVVKRLETAEKTIADADAISRADPEQLRKNLDATLRRRLGSAAVDE